MPACHLEPADKKQLISDVGERLVAEHGQKKYYKPKEVEQATLDLGYQVDYVCWAYCIFTSPQDFTMVHEAMGEVCDYVKMKGEVLADLAQGKSFLDLDIDLSWLEWPDIDITAIFDWFDWA